MKNTMVQNGHGGAKTIKAIVTPGFGPALCLHVDAARLDDSFESVVRDGMRTAPPGSAAAQLIDSLLRAREQGPLRVESNGRFHKGEAPAAEVLGLRSGAPTAAPGAEPGARPGVARLMREWAGGAA